MPTPSDGLLYVSQAPLGTESLLRRSANTTCPPDDSRVIAPSSQAPDDDHDQIFGLDVIPQQTSTPPAEVEPLRMEDQDGSLDRESKLLKSDEPLTAVDTPSPTASASDTKDVESHVDISGLQAQPQPSVSAMILPMHSDLSHARLLPNYTYFLHPGSKFRGTQQSERQIYDVQVELKHVDMSQSFLCGYLRIQGLTEDHPTLTTYFEGEIVGDKYTFQTKHPEWGSNDRVDKHHWERFPAYRPLAKQVKKYDFAVKNFAQREHLFMRWKEYFLIPDHKVRTISGASFEGFYYICFNQVSGAVSGIYFHGKSEKHQQLELKYVQDRGCFGAMEFR